MKTVNEKLDTIRKEVKDDEKPNGKNPKDVKEELAKEDKEAKVKDKKRPGRVRHLLIKEEQK